MKENEKEILDSVNEEFNLKLIWNDYQYNKFDAENKNYIVEIKDIPTLFVSLALFIYLI
jgi:hypothetical protein